MIQIEREINLAKVYCSRKNVDFIEQLCISLLINRLNLLFQLKIQIVEITGDKNIYSLNLYCPNASSTTKRVDLVSNLQQQQKVL